MKTCYLVTTAVDIVGGECNCVSDISTVFLDEDKVMPENSVVRNGTETVYYDYFPTREAAEEFRDFQVDDIYCTSRY
jgi:hypothetical protein